MDVMQNEELRKRVMGQAQGALSLDIAYIGIVNKLFTHLAGISPATPKQLTEKAGMDADYVIRWCDAAYAFEYLEQPVRGTFALTPLGRAFIADQPGNLMPFAIQSVMSAHMAERAAGLMRTGDRPGEKILTEWETVLPWFGPMLEHMFGPLLENEIIDRVPVFHEVDAKRGVIVDLGCGNGWYLRALIRRCPRLRGVGLDGFKENIKQAGQMAEREGLSGRLTFAVGDIYNFHLDEPVNLIAMNRSLHHVWDQKEKIFAILRDHLCPGGTAVIWEPNWPLKHEDLRIPNRRGLAFQNISEHVLGNNFLHADEIVAEFESVGLEPEVFYVADGRDVIVTGAKSK